MKVIIRTVEKAAVDYIVDSLSGNYGWAPITDIDPVMISRFLDQVLLLSEKANLYDIVLTEDCKLETLSDHITLRYREHLATLDRKDFERIEII